METTAKTVLIVDDSPVQAIVLRRILARAKFETITAKDGVEALEILEGHTIDIVISDINMPNMDGYELCKQIKTDKETFNIPVILCTVLSSPEALIHGLEVGADSYITRPYNEEQLIKLTSELLSFPTRDDLQTDRESIQFEGKTYAMVATPQRIVNFLISTYRNIHEQNKELNVLRDEIEKGYAKLEETQKEQEQLLLNILPESVANELIAYGNVKPHRFEKTSVMFIDFKGFSNDASKMNPQDLVQALSYYFDHFDDIISEYKMERIKTMGDGYMCASGVPILFEDHAIRCVNAALKIRKFIHDSAPSLKEKYGTEWKARIGIHSGPVIAGVVGKKRFAYDIWGDTVNLASRMESSGIAGEINVSGVTYNLIKDKFQGKSRGVIPIRNKEGVEREEEMFLIDPTS